MPASRRFRDTPATRPHRAGWLPLALALCVLGLGLAQPVLAASVSREQAVEQALRQNGGRGKVLGVREETEGGQRVYSVKILTDGHVRIYRVRAD